MAQWLQTSITHSDPISQQWFALATSSRLCALRSSPQRGAKGGDTHMAKTIRCSNITPQGTKTTST